MRDDELLAEAEASETTFTRRRRRLEDFLYDEVQEKFWDTTTGILLGARSVDGAIPRDGWPLRENRNGELVPTRPSLVLTDVDVGQTVEGTTWWPGMPTRIENFVVSDRGTQKVMGANAYNTYVKPNHHHLPPPTDPQPWIDHVRRLFPNPGEAEVFFDFAAHMLQRPHEKVNWGVVMAGEQGVGKDTTLLPLRVGVGEINAAEISPDDVASGYNGYVRSVLLVINEVRPHDEDHKAANFYNQLKPILASPPEMLPMTLKYVNTVYIRNLCHVVLTTNDPLTMYIPEGDRRLYVLTSPVMPGALDSTYFRPLHQQLANGGTSAVIRWLMARDLSQFDPCEPPPMTAAKKRIVDSSNYVRRSFVDDVFEAFCELLGQKPQVFFHRDLTTMVRELDMFDDARKAVNQLNAKNFHYKMSERGYDMERPDHAQEFIHGKFRSRSAFVSKGIPEEARLQLIEEELTRRPLTFRTTH